ncbi:RAD55 family ATPase [Natronococcus occultus]|uniref:RecA-superfamily ATPase possibly involved in signal transduction n=1 Tax=Natronococcus occultus SP4 TaxID=694430 RepID=L0JYI1_9EURY|nr:RecA superfamily ATPase [Natronococcus occultus]AGB36908.1 RecA-superfamily ATPase possibly involved in signal transduction [Natronococcus occultus SP4]
MYDLATVGPDVEVEPGTNVLVSGPPLTGKHELALDVLKAGAARGEGTIVVSTKDGAETLLPHFPDEANVGIVDCVTEQRGVGTAEDDPRVSYADSPVDMTGIGVELSAFLQEFYEDRELARNRVLLSSVSTLLTYGDLQTVFRFLHVFTGRLQSADALGVYVIDATAHDEQTMNTLKQLFDGLVEVEAAEDGEPTVRTTGLAR